MLRVVIAAAAAMLAAAPALAAESGGCSRFPWPIEADAALLAKASTVESGAALDASAPNSARLTLTAAGEARFEIAPERAPPEGSFAGVLRFEARAGTYQVTLSDRAWVDLVQGGKALKPAAFGGVKDCEGARKSLRFELKDGPATLQVSDVSAPSIAIVIGRAP